MVAENRFQHACQFLSCNSLLVSSLPAMFKAPIRWLQVVQATGDLHAQLDQFLLEPELLQAIHNCAAANLQWQLTPIISITNQVGEGFSARSSQLHSQLRLAYGHALLTKS